MIAFQGQEAFSVPRDALFAQLSNARLLVGCLPDAEVVSANEDAASWKLKPKLTFLSGSLDTELKVVQRVPGELALFLILGKAIGASSTTQAELKFLDAPQGTLVPWSAEIQALTGLLKMVPKGLIQATAQKVIQDVWKAIHEQVEKK